MGIFGLSKPDVEKMKAKKDVKGLIKALEYKKESSVRCAAAEALGKIGYAGAVESLVQVLNDEERDVRSEAAKALGKIKDKRAVEPLTHALKDENPRVRMSAAGALEEIGDKKAVEPLTQALKDEVWTVRENVAQTLGKVKDGRAVEPLIQALKDIHEDVRWRAAESLGLIGKPAVEPLIQALRDEDPRVRMGAVFPLGETRDARAVQPLMQIVKGSTDLLEVEPLTHALKDKHVDVRRRAAESLGLIGDKVENAISALGKIDEQAFAQAVDILVQKLTGENAEIGSVARRVLKDKIDMVFDTPSAKEVVAETVSVCARMKEQKEKEIVEGLMEMIPMILPYMMIGDDPYERIFREINTRSVDKETATLVLEGVLSFLRLASKNLKSKKLKKEVEELLERICWQDGVYPIGDVVLSSEAIARRVLMGLPIASQEDPRRNTDPATSTYFDYDDRVRIYNLDEATRNIYSYWVYKSSAETYKRCKVEETRWGKNLAMAKDYKYSDGSGGMRGFNVARLDDNRFLFYGSDVEQWRASG